MVGEVQSSKGSGVAALGVVVLILGRGLVPKLFSHKEESIPFHFALPSFDGLIDWFVSAWQHTSSLLIARLHAPMVGRHSLPPSSSLCPPRAGCSSLPLHKSPKCTMPTQAAGRPHMDAGPTTLLPCDCIACPTRDTSTGLLLTRILAKS